MKAHPAFSTIIALLIIAMFSTVENMATAQDLNSIRFDAAIEDASRLITAGKVEEAERVLNGLNRDHPNDQRVLALMKQLYMQAKDFDKALDAIKKLERLVGPTANIHLQYGEVYLRMGETVKAQEEFEKILSGGESDISILPRISSLYRSVGMYDKAAQVYVDARERFRMPKLFARELGLLYEVQRDYASAVREYYIYMTADTMNTNTGTMRLQRLVNYVDDSADMQLLKQAFAELVRLEPGAFAPKKFLADVLIRQDSLREAFVLYKDVDLLRKDQGRHLVYFAQRCLEHEDYELTAEVCRYVLNRYPGKPFYIQAHYVLSSAFVMQGRGDSAVAVLREVAENSSDFRDIMEANYYIGEVFLEQLQMPDSALVYFERVLDQKRLSGWHHLARLRIADSHLARGDLTVADSLYNEIEPRSLPEAEQERLAWNRAQVLFFDHDFAEAKRLYATLTTHYRKGLYVNDCLRRILLIDENSDLGSIDLREYSNAEFHIIKAEIDSAKAIFDKISHKTGSKIADLSLYRLAGIYLSLNEQDLALSSFQRLVDSFPESSWRGDALKNVGDIHWNRGEIELAEAAYRKLLMEFDNLLFQDHARSRLRQIENL